VTLAVGSTFVVCAVAGFGALVVAVFVMRDFFEIAMVVLSWIRGRVRLRSVKQGARSCPQTQRFHPTETTCYTSKFLIAVVTPSEGTTFGVFAVVGLVGLAATVFPVAGFFVIAMMILLRFLKVRLRRDQQGRRSRRPRLGGSIRGD
jgi:hypothetical protein